MTKKHMRLCSSTLPVSYNLDFTTFKSPQSVIYVDEINIDSLSNCICESLVLYKDLYLLLLKVQLAYFSCKSLISLAYLYIKPFIHDRFFLIRRQSSIFK